MVSVPEEIRKGRLQNTKKKRYYCGQIDQARYNTHTHTITNV
jgi:hypothetical protein